MPPERKNDASFVVVAGPIMDVTTQSDLATLKRRALIVGVAVLAVAALGGLANRAAFFQAYLLGFLFWGGIAIGCLSLLMLHHLVSGRWGYLIQRLLEAGVRTLPLLALAFVPLLFGLQDLYLWARPEVVAADALLRHKQGYLNGTAFFGRAAVYFLVWIGLGTLLTMLSDRQDQGIGTGPLTRRLQVLSGPGLVLYGLTVTFAAFDWVMSLEPHWFSSVYGMVFIVGQALLALAFAILVLAPLARRPALQGAGGPDRLHDLGNLLLALTMLWAYIAFSQYLIIWSGNLPEETSWYLRRMTGGWEAVALLLVVGHFLLPFLLLLSRAAKRRGPVLAGVAGGLLGMRLLDLFWLVAPALHPTGFALHWLDVAVPLGLGGIWLAAYLACLARRPLLPVRDPRFPAVAQTAPGAAP
jgi:hypothetical protein